MRIACQSDHHLDDGYEDLGESYLEVLPVPKADVLVLAGDLATDHLIIHKALGYLSKKVKDIIYVPGNHEHVDKNMLESRKSLIQACDIPGVHLLDDGFVDIDGVRFIGSTLWSDCGCPSNQQLIQEKIFKYWPIGFNDGFFTSADATRMHHGMLDYIRFQLSEARQRDLTSVVVSHHAPSKNSVHARFLSSNLNEAFYTDLDDFIELQGPRYWIHGHMHDSSQYVIGDTRVICNPQGSYNYGNALYNPGLVLNI